MDSKRDATAILAGTVEKLLNEVPSKAFLSKEIDLIWKAIEDLRDSVAVLEERSGKSDE